MYPTPAVDKKLQSLGSCSHSIYLLVLKGFFICPCRFDFISKKVGHVFFETVVIKEINNYSQNTSHGNRSSKIRTVTP